MSDFYALLPPLVCMKYMRNKTTVLFLVCNLLKNVVEPVFMQAYL